MPQSLVQVYLHVVFSTNDRQPFLREQNVRTELHAYLAGTCKYLGVDSLQVGGVEDHVHLCCRLSWEASLGSGRLRWKEASLEGGFAGRRLRWKEASLEGGFAGRRLRWKEASLEGGFAGVRPCVRCSGE